MFRLNRFTRACGALPEFIQSLYPRFRTLCRITANEAPPLVVAGFEVHRYEGEFDLVDHKGDPFSAQFVNPPDRLRPLKRPDGVTGQAHVKNEKKMLKEERWPEYDVRDGGDCYLHRARAVVPVIRL